MELSISERVAYSTIRIECEYGKIGSGTGTGFFFNFLENKELNQHVPVIITNKHVVRNASKGKLIFSLSDEAGNPKDTDHYEVIFENFESLWKFHPDPNVDLCALPIAPAINELSKKGIRPFYMSLDKSLIPNAQQIEGLSVLEEILMVGYPNGIWDHVNNQPILRRGITATHPAKDYEGRKELMIDAACFPGSSGSPVLIFNEFGYSDKRGNVVMGQARIFLLGVLYAGPQHTAQGEIEIVDVPVVNKPISISRIPNNLGLVIKSERILELEALFK